MSNRPAAVQRHRRQAAQVQNRVQRRNRAWRRVRRDMRLPPNRREDLKRSLLRLTAFCEACRKRPYDRFCNLPGNWLPTRLCDACLHGDDYDAWWHAGWRPMCVDCGGSGDVDDCMRCESCDGEGVIDW
ncbi:MAG: hypothetical protein ABR562_05560 [Thermoplasmatota archaeon]|nr:hypothetical protein [Halobacteriales archaeon]